MDDRATGQSTQVIKANLLGIIPVSRVCNNARTAIHGPRGPSPLQIPLGTALAPSVCPMRGIEQEQPAHRSHLQLVFQILNGMAYSARGVGQKPPFIPSP
eukprot:5589460-Amphidinium_carterae.1